jgi:hypothetical protein
MKQKVNKMNKNLVLKMNKNLVKICQLFLGRDTTIYNLQSTIYNLVIIKK